MRLFQQVQRSRPFEPHSYRDLARSLEAAGNYGLAALQYEIILAGAWHNRFGADLKNVALEEYALMMREAISKKVTCEHKFVRQTGGHGQYGHCVFDLQPGERGSGFVFDNDVVGGVIPKEFIPSIEKGVKEGAKLIAQRYVQIAHAPESVVQALSLDIRVHGKVSPQAFKVVFVF